MFLDTLYTILVWLNFKYIQIKFFDNFIDVPRHPHTILKWLNFKYIINNHQNQMIHLILQNNMIHLILHYQHNID